MDHQKQWLINGDKMTPKEVIERKIFLYRQSLKLNKDVFFKMKVSARIKELEVELESGI